MTMVPGFITRVAAGIVCMLLLVGSCSAGTPSETNSVCPSARGVYVGSAAPEQVEAFEQWSGQTVGCVEDFLSSETWRDIAYPEWWVTRWASASPRRNLILSVPLLPDSGGTLRAGSEGQYDHHFQSLAMLLVQAGYPDAIIRLGWEFNAGEFPWAIYADDPEASPENFAAYWHRVATVMRAVDGARFTLDWTVNNGYSEIPAEKAYPGDDVVDVIGVDAYDQVWGPQGAQVADPVARWRAITSGEHNLDWWADFAAVHHKGLAVSEWGAIQGGHGGGDNAYYVTEMLNWAESRQVLYQVYFDSGRSRISTGALPAVAESYKRGVARR